MPLLALLLGSCASMLGREQKRERAAKAALEQQMDSVKAIEARRAIEAKAFVLEATEVTFKRGKRVYVNETTNFIAVAGDKAIVQISPMNGGGPNGVGGFTVEGNVSNFKSSTLKNGEQRVSFGVSGANISATVSITMRRNSSKATGIVTPNFNSNTVTLDGRIVEADMSSAFRGLGW